MDDYQSLVRIYDQHAPDMENVAVFYEWVLDVFSQYNVPLDRSILDVGCGTGHLAVRLYQSGYHHISGTDFSQGCLNIAAAHNLPMELFQHDIVTAPVPKVYDIVFTTGVIDLVTDPLAALRNISQSLESESLLFISIRNLDAYAPWYHLAPLASKLNRWPRAKHWFYQFTTPLSLRRDDYPVDNMFTPSEMREMLQRSGLTVIGEHSTMILPMFWIWDMPRLLGVMKRVNRLVGSPGRLGYRYMFVCKKI